MSRLSKGVAVGRPRTVSDGKIAEAIERYHGIVKSVAAACGLSRQGLWKRLDANPELKAAVKEAREGLVDLAEGQLLKAVKRGDAWAVRLVLITIGRGRGYTRGLDVSGNISGNGIVLMLPDDGRDKPEADEDDDDENDDD